MDSDELISTLTKIMEKQTHTIIERLNKMELEIKPLQEENQRLKEKVGSLENKIKVFERNEKRNNFIVYGIPENRDSEEQLITKIINILKNDLNINLEKSEVVTAYRLGKYVMNKNRPILVKIVTIWKKNEIMRHKKNLKNGVRISEDFPKEILIKRQELQEDLKREREKGNIAFLKYDKIVIKPKQRQDENPENKKRPLTTSPTMHENESTVPIRGPSKINKRDAFSIMRERSMSQPSTSKQIYKN